MPSYGNTVNMLSSNQDRSGVTINNSNAKCLLENWVEERAIQHLEPYDKNCGLFDQQSLYKHGHVGLLTLDYMRPMPTTTTHIDDYKPPAKSTVRARGKKEEMMAQMFAEEYSQEIQRRTEPVPTIAAYQTETQLAFDQPRFIPTKKVPTQAHNYRLEQPVTFWTEHKETIPGVTNIKTFDTPFRRNDAFSQPISEYVDDPTPYDHDNAPNM